MSTHLDAYQALCDHARQTAVLGAIESLLAWDERTMLPAAGGAYRAEQVSLLSGMIHRRRTDERVGQWLEQLVASPLAADPHCDTGATIRELKRDYDKRVKLPQRLVEELARVAVLGQQAWAEARKRDDFASFAPLLDRIVQLKIEQAEAVGYANCRYDALLDDFEPGETTANVRRVLTALREELVPLVEQIQASDRRPNTGILRRQFPVGRQRDLVRRAAALVGDRKSVV